MAGLVVSDKGVLWIARYKRQREHVENRGIGVEEAGFFERTLAVAHHDGDSSIHPAVAVSMASRRRPVADWLSGRA